MANGSQYLRLVLTLGALALHGCADCASTSSPTDADPSRSDGSVDVNVDGSAGPGADGSTDFDGGGGRHDRLPHTVDLDPNGIRIDGRFTLLRGGSVQWFRIPEEAWDERLARFRAAGFNAVDIYIPWNVIEPEQGEFDFETRDLRRFLELCEKHELWVVVRPGPYITNEMDGGGLPAWLTRNASKKSYDEDGRVNLRTHDPDFIEPVRAYFAALNRVLEPYYATNGGRILLYTIENEYNWFETAFGVDKAFWYEGGTERPVGQEFRPDLYMEALRDAVLDTGTDIPIVTCPGDGQISAMGDVPGVLPFPNIYEWATPKQPEEAAADLLEDMHDPEAHDGVYLNAPSGSLEVARSAQLFRRLFIGGLDALFGFNLAGMVQEGRLNSITLAARGGDEDPHWGPPGQPQAPWVSGAFDVSFDEITNGFVSPRFGYFHNVLDYEGAMGPSGLPRELYYRFRRDNLFFDTVGEQFASAGHPKRSGDFPGADGTLAVDHPELGTREEERGRVHYWLDAGDGVAFASILNQSGAQQNVPVGGIRFREETLPRFAPMTVPLAEEPNSAYAKLLTFGLPLVGEVRLAYATGELLTSRPFNGDHLLVVYDVQGATGELALDGLSGAELVHTDDDIDRVEATDGRWTFTHRVDDGLDAHAVVRLDDGSHLRIVATTRARAGRFWFPTDGDETAMITGVEGLRDVRFGADTLTFTYEHDGSPKSIGVMSPFPASIPGGRVLRPWDEVVRTSTTALEHDLALPLLPDDLATGRSVRDTAEAATSFDDSGWRALEGEPTELEHLDIYRGHAWYRAHLDLESSLGLFNRGRVYVEHASDIVGIYVNGRYLSTVAPGGTEIDSHGRNADYRFEAAKEHLREGRNVIAFRTEIWGHGSFMFPRGNLIATPTQFPALGYEGMKGLSGEATVGGIPLERWTVRAGLGGDLAGYADPDFDDGSWAPATIPMTLSKGEVRWYRTSFETSDLPEPDRLLAPVVAALRGQRTKGTIYVNGRLIGRWLSDDEWLRQGTWGRPTRSMWIANDPDHFPVPHQLLRSDGSRNVLAIAFEDVSHSDDPPGVVEALSLAYNDERYDWTGDGYRRGTSALRRRSVTTTP